MVHYLKCYTSVSRRVPRNGVSTAVWSHQEEGGFIRLTSWSIP